MLLLAVDTNFRLKNRMRANEINNPPLGPEWGYWVEPTKYREHLKNYVHEKDVSTCIAFAALFQKDTQLTTRLCVSGVGGVVCARHECMRPNGLGDVQKGERYANMDFVVMAALAGFSLLILMLLYNIACQWQVNLRSQMVKLPEEMCLPLDSMKLQCALPVWHAASHNEDCQSTNSLSFKEGAGKMDGEGVEWTWAEPGAICDTNITEGTALQQKLIVALEECKTQIHVFEIVNETVDHKVQKQWKGMICTWLKDSSAPNPHTLHRKGELAGQQILAELAGTVLLAPDRKNKIQECFRTLQNIYMPGAAVAIKEAEGDCDGDEAPPKLESIDLWMPSGIAADDVSRGCVAGLVNMEVKLCVAQCQNALLTLCSRLYATRFLIAYRSQNVTGQKRLTKATVLIHQVGDQVEAVAKKYRRGCEVLVGLGVADEHLHLRPLKVEDVRLDGDAGETDAAARKKLAMIGAGRSAHTPHNAPGTSKRKMSWIWTALGAFDDEEMRLDECDQPIIETSF
ncbi:hypothetical protein B0H14DRAFT_2590758 [Mycena olivaceomarginata]|nr:hypothetical protein B0H14DRAFT_2590758 [Mycena olivaceomarginata]